MIRVDAENGAYDVVCEWGASQKLGSLMRDAGLEGSAFIITDRNVAKLHALDVAHMLRTAGFGDVEIFLDIAPGEASKSLRVARILYDWLYDCRAERGSPIVALGGGVIGDLAGFVAATWMRGLPFVQVPTSLLAMVDASIGGKVAIDHPRGKNLIGAFYPPRLVVEDPALLTSLPPRSFREGFAEIIKHGFILDPPMLDILEDAAPLLAMEPKALTEMVARNAALKAGVVSGDEREAGRRMILNYGHTIGHAIEAVSGYRRIRHGEAISAGMMAAAQIGRRMGITPAHIGERQARLFETYKLPLRHPGLEADAVLAAIALDKKVAGKKVRWVLLEDAGRPIIRDDVPAEIVRDVVMELVG